MKTITATGLALLATFTIGIIAEQWTVVIVALIATIAWSIAVDRTSRQPRGWYQD